MAVYAPSDNNLPQEPPPGVDPDMWARMRSYGQPSITPEIIPPENSTIPSGKQVGPWTNPFSDAHINPATGQPEFVGGPNATIGPGSQAAGGGFNFPNIMKLFGGGNPYWRGAIAGAGAIAPTPAETGELSPRFFTGQGVQPGLSAPQGTPYEVPRGMSGRAVDAPQTYPHMPWPDTGTAPVGARVPLTPSRPATTIPPNAVGIAPTAAAPPSNMFTTVDAPNANPGIGGGMMGGALARGGPSGRGQITALDLSHLFGGGQPAAAPLPKKKINVGKIPDSATAEVPPDTVSKAPSDYGPLQRNRRWKLEGSPDLYR